MSLVSKDSIIKACADAYKEGAGGESVKVGELASSILAALTSGGSLPEGWATGELTLTNNINEESVSVEHGLGTIPNYIIIWAENDELLFNQWRLILKYNFDIVLDEATGQSVQNLSGSRGMYDTTSGVGSSNAAYDYDDDDRVFWTPYYGSRFYNPETTYRWLAISFNK